MLTKPKLEITPVSGALGAEISGVNLSENLSDETIQEIRQALLDYLVIFFRDQELTAEQHLAFARRFGELDEHDFVKGYPIFLTSYDWFARRTRRVEILAAFGIRM
jgi:alpha-ketoglutarate-dependent taurine dioxygenase